MLVRRLTAGDLDALWALRLRALTDNPEAFGATYEETVTHGQARMRQRLGQGDEAFSLGAFEDTLIGMVGFRRAEGAKDRHKGFIFGMYVHPEQRERGVGRALMQELIAQVKPLPGLEQLHLAVVTTNRPACHLYRSMGFEVYGTEPRALKHGEQYWDEDLMVLRLRV
jgi:ribosomal protein S18 acetylase RimI-like enzyme